MLGLDRELDADFTVKHFHEQLVKRHDWRRGYMVTKLHLHRSGLVKPAPRRSAHRKKRPRRPLPGARAARHRERLVGNDNTVKWRRLSLQIPPSPRRPHFVRAKVRVHEYPTGCLAVFLGPHRLADDDAADRPSNAHALAA